LHAYEGEGGREVIETMAKGNVTVTGDEKVLYWRTPHDPLYLEKPKGGEKKLCWKTS